MINSSTAISALAPPIASPSITSSWGFTGSSGSWIVPASVTTIHVTLQGASGGSKDAGEESKFGGFGAIVSATLSVTPSSTLLITVGGQGSNVYQDGGFNGGGNGGTRGGGGRTHITAEPFGVVIIAAGGGGACSPGHGANGGNPNGGSTSNSNGGTQTAPGSGQYQFEDSCAGSFGSGGDANLASCGGGGGGGYYGGGAGWDGEGGGGGSSYCDGTV